MTERSYKKKMDEHCRRFNRDNMKNGLKLSYELRSEPGKITSEIRLNSDIILTGSVSLQKTPSILKAMDSLYDGFISSSIHIAVNAVHNAMKRPAIERVVEPKIKPPRRWYKRLFGFKK